MRDEGNEMVEDEGQNTSSEPTDGDVTTVAIRRSPIYWESYLRCLFLTVILFLVGAMAYRPALLRLSVLRSLANPSHGDSLAWTPEPAAPTRPAEPRRVVAPGEWRPAGGNTAGWLGARPASREAPARGGAIASSSWRRHSENPWRWWDDGGEKTRRGVEGAAGAPPQKPESPFRVGDIAVWPTTPTPTASPESGAQLASLPPLSPLPAMNNDIGTPGSLLPAQRAPVSPVPTLEPLAPLPAIPSSATASTASAPERPAPSASAPTQPASRPGNAAEPVDWANREITGPIPGAYLTIYPKLKFIGLCVPGQGYIRKYNQVGVPADLANPKMTARDGRTPYGRYYIASRRRDADGPRLFLSWPSPDDARRIGLDVGKVAEVEYAWRTQTLPPQDTPAGGGVGITGLRNWVETTEGGFSLEEPHMEEIFTALPDKAWIFIQP